MVRYGLPAVVGLVGVVIMCLGSEDDLEGGAGILGAALAIYAINWFLRVAFAGEAERQAEQQARDYFAAHGYWPGEQPDRLSNVPEHAQGQPAPADSVARRRLVRLRQARQHRG
ncbi:MAG TPA: hypothetical protein VIC05_10620 [Solirubrobacteraceae bacterium]|jgi:hypothetical protein